MRSRSRSGRLRQDFMGWLVMRGRAGGGGLIADAVELVLGADEEAVMGDADGGADGLVITGGFAAVTHVCGVQQFEAVATGFDDKDFAPEVHAVDFAVGSGGGGFEFSAGGQFATPENLACGGINAANGFAI